MPVGSSWDCQAPPASHVFSPSLLPRYNYERDPAMRYEDLAKPPSYADLNGTSGQKDTKYQLSISIALGLASLLGFCILRPRWSALYAARKKQKDAASSLPELPSTLFGWVLPLWRITDQQILASAGLDAYVFLRFFRMAGTFLAITCFFALAVIKPVHDVYGDQKRGDGGKDKDKDALFMLQRRFAPSASADFHASKNSTAPDQDQWIATDYLWMYLIFAYLFSILLMYMIVANTRTVIEIRQEFLGSQTTITDRTVRLSGVPADLQSEDKIKSFMEGLEIGKVESVTICRDWSALDDLIARREGVLRKLEKAIVSHDGSAVQSRSSANGTSSRETLPTAVPYRDEEDGHDEDQALLFGGNQAHVTPNQGDRPTKTIRFGRFNLHSKKVDAIDHYQALLKQIDGDIEHLRKTEFATVPMAFVTMDSVAAAQMAIQAVLDPSPLQLLANQSPAPENVIWPNTYLPRRQRMLRAWSITALIVLLTIFWSLLFAPLAYILSIDNIRKALPAVGKWLKDHQFVASLIRTQLPTLVVSLLNIAVPYLYEWLANKQGMTSRSDVELSVISKNFFFTFFNFFVVFTILGTASNLFSLWQSIEERLRNTTFLLHKLAESLGDLVGFYTNFLILQGLGLLPFKLLQVGSLSLYPWYRYGATTPRELAELSQPSVFSYGLFLPQTLLIFDICLVYSVLEDSWQILLSGLVYFIIGSFIYKYQLLYAMDERQHSTGRVWIMMCDRVLVGLIVFQLTVGGQLVLRNIDARGALLLPLVIATIWFSYAYNKTYRPLMQFIALKSVRTAEHLDYPGYTDDELPEDMRRWRDVSGERSRATSRSRESRGKFVNPSLIIPLEGPWVGDKSQLASGGNDDSIGHGDNSV